MRAHRTRPFEPLPFSIVDGVIVYHMTELQLATASGEQAGEPACPGSPGSLLPREPAPPPCGTSSDAIPGEPVPLGPGLAEARTKQRCDVSV